MVDPIFILFVLGVNVVAAEVLAKHTVAKHLGATLLVMIITAVVANLGVIPTSASDAPIYDGILHYVTPLAIFWLLLRVNLRDVLKAGMPMIALFLIGSFGTAVGVLIAMWLVNGSESIGESYRAIGGIFVGTYTGGGVNFNALALHYGINKQVAIFGGITAVDNILTTVWMAASIALPRLLARIWPRARFGIATVEDNVDQNECAESRDTETVHPVNLGFLLAIGAGSLWISELTAGWMKSSVGVSVPSIVILTTIALVMAQIPLIQRQRGSQVLGLFAMYLFLAAIAALCDISALREMGSLGVTLFVFASLVIAIHALITFAAAAVLRIDVNVAAIASQANIGGATTALGVAKSLNRRDLVLPAVLVGSLGYAVGTYLGFAVAEFLL
jgi:uncharacterized membrane protein